MSIVVVAGLAEKSVVNRLFAVTTLKLHGVIISSCCLLLILPLATTASFYLVGVYLSDRQKTRHKKGSKCSSIFVHSTHRNLILQCALLVRLTFQLLSICL